MDSNNTSPPASSNGSTEENAASTDSQTSTGVDSHAKTSDPEASSEVSTTKGSSIDEASDPEASSEVSITKGSSTDEASDPKILSQLAQFKAINRAAGLVLWAAVVLTIITLVILTVIKGFYYGLGALEGGALVVIDVVIFRWFVSNTKPGPSTTPLWKTVIKFYLVSLANILVCFVVIKFDIGSPLTFLAGLGVFLPAFVLGLLLSLFGRPKKA
jgi:hypothetical protein